MWGQPPCAGALFPGATPHSDLKDAPLPSVPVGDRVTPIPAERTAADANPRRGLAALVFVPLHHVEHTSHRGALETSRLNLVHRQILLDECLEDRIQHFVG